MRHFRFFIPTLLVVLTLACGDSETISEIEVDQGPRQLADQYVTPVNDMGSEQDGSLISDMSAPNLVTDCAELCERMSECNSSVLGNRTECPETCSTLEELEGFSDYLACISQASCAQIGQCNVPRPPPPTCSEVCASLENCSPAARLPSAFSDVEDCTSGCEVEGISEAVVICGGAIADGSSECNGDTFSSCLADQLYPTCYAVCDRKLMCNAAEDLVDCVVACAAPMADTDPVTRRRARLRQTCWQTAEGCEAAVRCDEPLMAPVIDPSELCQADAACGLISDCEEVVTALGPTLGNATLSCVADRLTQSCDTNISQCFIEADVEPLDCDEYCAVAALCGELPSGASEFECTGQCRTAVMAGDTEAIAPFKRLTACAYVETCEAFQNCLNRGSDADVCNSACDNLSACGSADSAACASDCSDSGTLRETVHWSCNALINSCVEPSRCTTPPAPDCTVICGGLSTCGESSDDCVRTCDNEAFLAPQQFIERYACHAVARNCPDRQTCEDGDYVAGRACLQYCNGLLDCSGDQTQMLSCIDDCATGLSGDAGLAFEFNYACFQELGDTAQCDDINACDVSPTPESICSNVCTAQADCALIEAGGQNDCESACLADVANNPDAYACALRAGRVTNGCGDLAVCLDIEVPEADPSCVRQCEARAQCDASSDQFLCERQCDSATDGTSLRLSCLDAQSACDATLSCLDNPLPDPAICTGICATLAICDGQLGPDGRYLDVAACEIACGIDGLINTDIDYAEASVCLGESDCVDAEIDRCLSGGGATPTCDNAWTAYEDCGNDTNPLWSIFTPVTDRASYLIYCNALITDEGASVIEPRLECVINAAASNMCDQQIACAF